MESCSLSIPPSLQLIFLPVAGVTPGDLLRGVSQPLSHHALAMFYSNTFPSPPPHPPPVPWGPSPTSCQPCPLPWVLPWVLTSPRGKAAAFFHHCPYPSSFGHTIRAPTSCSQSRQFGTHQPRGCSVLVLSRKTGAAAAAPATGGEENHQFKTAAQRCGCCPVWVGFFYRYLFPVLDHHGCRDQAGFQPLASAPCPASAPAPPNRTDVCFWHVPLRGFLVSWSQRTFSAGPPQWNPGTAFFKLVSQGEGVSAKGCPCNKWETEE